LWLLVWWIAGSNRAGGMDVCVVCKAKETRRDNEDKKKKHGRTKTKQEKGLQKKNTDEIFQIFY
jgi:hypothetical protein